MLHPLQRKRKFVIVSCLPKWGNSTAFEMFKSHNAYRVGWEQISEGIFIEATLYFEYPDPFGGKPIKHEQTVYLDPNTKKVVQQEYLDSESSDEEDRHGPVHHEKVYGYLRDVYFPSAGEFPPRSKMTKNFSFVGRVTYSVPVVFHYEDRDSGSLYTDKGCYLYPNKMGDCGSWHIVDKSGNCYDNFIPNPWVIWWCRLPGK